MGIGAARIMPLIRSLPRQDQSPSLKGQRVSLRPPRIEDWEEWSALRETSRDFLTPWEPSWAEDELSKPAFRQRLRRQANDAREGIGYAFLIFRESDNALLGGATLSGVSRGVRQSAALGYWIGQPFVRKGYMSDALRALNPFAFGSLSLHRVEAACIPDNEASRNLLVKNGFRQEGYARSYLKINGRWRDHLLFSRLETDPPLE